MPILTEEQIIVLQNRVRTAAMVGLAKALNDLLEVLPKGRAKHNQVIVLTGRNNDILSHEIGNTLSPDLLAILRNELRKDLLLFTDHLTLADFGPKPTNRPELKPGHLLYKVSPVMKLRETHKCIIRIAHQLNQVLEGIEMDESVGLEQVSVSKVMEIEVIDPMAKDNPAFDILLLSDGEQFVDEYSATEWVFNVRPLRLGKHSLVLKISILLKIDGKERTRNIVHQRAVSVQTEATTADVSFVRPIEITTSPSIETASPPPPVPDFPLSPPKRTPANEELPAPSPVNPINAPAAAPLKRSQRMRFLSIAATFLLLAAVSFWMLYPSEGETTLGGQNLGAPDPNSQPVDSLGLDTFAPVLPVPAQQDTL